jgi:hypothetical protein
MLYAFRTKTRQLATQLTPALAALGEKVSNFNNFNLATFEIFHQSCVSFPSIAHISPDDVAKSIATFYEGDVNLKDLNELAQDTTSWLIREGYLNSHGLDTEYMSVSITEKGLRACNKKPHSIDKNSFREVFASGIKSTSPNVISAAIIEIFKSNLGC